MSETKPEIITVGNPEDIWSNAVELSNRLQQDLAKSGSTPAIQVLGAALNLAFNMFSQTRLGTEMDRTLGAHFLTSFAKSLRDKYGFFVISVEEEPDHRSEYLG